MIDYSSLDSLIPQLQQRMSLMDAMIATQQGLSLGDQCYALLHLSSLKDEVDKLKTELNKTIDKYEERLAIQIGQETDENQVRLPEAVFTATAKSFPGFSPTVETTRLVCTYLRKHGYESEVSIKKAIKSLTEDLLAEGKTLPPFIKVHTKASIRITRNGKERNESSEESNPF